ncbi:MULTISPECIES: uracil-DNA glycosylase [unclassified Ensifer]|uniref:uracil-DNA glycosylase n=1 Tax=unclassified Ensifer TaxID=2633371 RepID=UPI000813C2D3|nr:MULTISPECIES: uracil-DNA glycosylase [unclassified Ensifer]OCP00436.1 uracil-DNA glycosylase [Ensifer sp. LC14]OCP01975.1 uracil-DNA glycosylase [Ensifer sp. LC11]OCP02293.1 uracil-DNA glycosylase [Ensifer sp. LC13]OCP29784.1 uracil-DNA glycosylase [Ensifer sp. LC499]
MISAHDLSPAELAALLAFHADAGVEWLLEEEPVDRFAEFEAMKAARGNARAPAANNRAEIPTAQPAARQTAAAAAPASAPSRESRAPAPTASAPAVAIPDAQAIEEARFAAESARSLAELRLAMEGFAGCNLRNSARNLVFAEGDAATGIMIVGPMPYADDDRDGQPFAGRLGEMLTRMLAGIGLTRETVFLSNVVPWRPPGNRVPTAREADICRPFIERQIALAEPKHLLLLGNFTARFFFGGSDTIHQLRGEWRDLQIGGITVPTLATLHPQDLVTAPVNKRFAWQDLLAFNARIRG